MDSTSTTATQYYVPASDSTDYSDSTYGGAYSEPTLNGYEVKLKSPEIRQNWEGWQIQLSRKPMGKVVKKAHLTNLFAFMTAITRIR